MSSCRRMADHKSEGRVEGGPKGERNSRWWWWWWWLWSESQSEVRVKFRWWEEEERED